MISILYYIGSMLLFDVMREVKPVARDGPLCDSLVVTGQGNERRLRCGRTNEVAFAESCLVCEHRSHSIRCSNLVALNSTTSYARLDCPVRSIPEFDLTRHCPGREVIRRGVPSARKVCTQFMPVSQKGAGAPTTAREGAVRCADAGVTAQVGS